MLAIIVLIVLVAAILVLGITHVGSIGWTGGTASPISISRSYTGTGGVEIELTAANSSALAAAASDQLVPIGVAIATLKYVLITCTGNDGLVKVYTNDVIGGSPVHVFTFAAGGGLVEWGNDTPAGTENPFVEQSATDVTKFYFKNAGTLPADVNVRILY